MVVPICLIASTNSWVATCIPAIWLLISLVALAVCAASAFTSCATTAKPRPEFAGARRLDGGVQRQQIGLLRDRGDQVDHIADPQRRLRQFVDARIGDFGLIDGLAGDPVQFLDLPADLGNRRASSPRSRRQPT